MVNQWGGYPYQGHYYGYGTISYPTYVTPNPYYGGYYPNYPYAPGVAPGAWVWNQQPFYAGPGMLGGNLAGMQPNAMAMNPVAPNRAPVQPNGIPAQQAAVPDPLLKPEALSPEQEILRRVSVLKPSDEAGRIRSDDLIADGDREFAKQAFRRAAGIYRQAISKAPIIRWDTCALAMPT